MKDLIPNLSLYDSFAILSPGLIICYGIFYSYLNEYSKDMGLFPSVLLLFLAYLIGLLWHKLSEFLFSGMRNSDEHIKEAREAVETENTSDWTSSVGSSYYKAYYSLMHEGLLGNVPLLEAQVAFLRNHALLVPAIVLIWGKFEDRGLCCLFVVLLILWGIFICPCSSNRCFKVALKVLYTLSIVCLVLATVGVSMGSVVDTAEQNVLSLLVAILLFGVMLYTIYSIQMKIYRLVWEGYLFSVKQEESKPCSCRRDN